jgi:hypothetical protein
VRERAAGWRRKAPVDRADQKMSWILRLEDQRILRAPAPPRAGRAAVPPKQTEEEHAGPAAARSSCRTSTCWPPTRAAIPARAALAIGRVGLPKGRGASSRCSTDADPEVRQMAAFALGCSPTRRGRRR